MTKTSRKMKWKGVALNHSNIDEYMKDLQAETKGQYITQGVSFNKDDNFQMNLLKNSILAHGSFSGFVKHLLYAHFEKKGSIDDSVWQPNSIQEKQEVKEAVVEQTSPSLVEELDAEEIEEVQVQEKEPVESKVEEKIVEKPIENPVEAPKAPQKRRQPKVNNISAFITPQDDDE